MPTGIITLFHWLCERMARKRSIFPAGSLIAVLVGAVIIPAVLSISVGIVALVLWRAPIDIIFSVLVLSFAAMMIAGAITGMAFVHRGARLAELQSDFIANVSHELRTPLAGIRLLVETLAMGRAEAPEKRREVLERLAAEEQRLEDLIERILQWRRLGAGPTRLPRVVVDVSELMEQVLAPLRAAHPDADLQLDLPSHLPPLWGARDDLVAVFSNLVHNAIKFAGDHGPIRISARDEGDKLLFRVSDDGPGVPPSDQRRIFDLFYRVPTQGRPGTGLGLAIVRRIVDEHAGRISLISTPGAGATFSVLLPAAQEPGK